MFIVKQEIRIGSLLRVVRHNRNVQKSWIRSHWLKHAVGLLNKTFRVGRFAIACLDPQSRILLNQRTAREFLEAARMDRVVLPMTVPAADKKILLIEIIRF